MAGVRGGKLYQGVFNANPFNYLEVGGAKLGWECAPLIHMTLQREASILLPSIVPYC